MNEQANFCFHMQKSHQVILPDSNGGQMEMISAQISATASVCLRIMRCEKEQNTGEVQPPPPTVNS